MLPPGGAEVDIAVLFADIRGSTGLGETLGPTGFANLLNRFYRIATDVLVHHNAIIDKMIGDEVMAWLPPVSGPDYRRRALIAAEEILRGVGFGSKEGPWLPLGVGVNAGLAYVGKVGTEGVGDLTALGDTVNTAARLQAEAKAGDIVMSEELYQEVADRHPSAERRVLELRGKDAAFAARVISMNLPQKTASN